MTRYHATHAELDEVPPCLRCNGTGTVFRTTGYSWRYGDLRNAALESGSTDAPAPEARGEQP